MPKVTVYLPEQLWDRVKGRPGGTTVSQLVQRALEGELGAGQRGSENANAQLVATRMKAEARAIYEAGFNAGVELAERLSWSHLDRLEEGDWDVDRWIEADPGFEAPTLRELVEQWREDHGPGGAKEDMRVDYHLAASEFETESYKAGWMDALKEIWGLVIRDLRTGSDSRQSQ